MSETLDRRQFLSLTAAGAAGLGLGSLLSGCSTRAGASEPLYRVSLAQWSLHRSLRGQQEPALDNLDFPAAARGFGIDAVEYVNQFFRDKAQDQRYLAEMRKRCEQEGVTSLLIMCDGEGRLGDPDAPKREQAVDNHEKWLAAAQALGCHSIRVNAASGGSWEEQRDRAAAGLRALCERAETYGLDVLVENHGGLSSNGEWLAQVMNAVEHPRIGTLPDFGNFRLGGGKEYDRYQGVRELMPFAKAVSAKSHDFDAAGDETHTDYRRMMEIVLDAGYRGWVGIEYEGGELSEREGILATKALLERVRAELAAARG